MKYSQVVERFLKYLESIDRSVETIEGYRKELRYFGEFLVEKYTSEKDIQDIILEDLEDYMYYIKIKGKAEATRNRVIYIFRSLYKYAYKRELCVKNLPLFLEAIKVKRKERFFLNENEIVELFNNIEKPVLKAAIQTMYYTGVRVSELLNLEIKDLDLDSRLLHIIDGKGKKDRVIPINKKLYLIIKDYIKNIRPKVGSDRLFCTKKTGRLSSQYINSSLKKAQENMNLKQGVSAHILRHSFASSLIKKNIPLPYLQKLLGHADLRVTSIYIHQEIDQLREAIELI